MFKSVQREEMYQIVHAIAGRCRIRVSQISGDPEYTYKLDRLLQSLDFVTNVRINAAASSVIVNYDIGRIASAAAQDAIFACIERASTAEIPLELKTTENTTEITAWHHLGLPILTLGVVLASPLVELSIPFLLINGLILAAALPIFNRAIAGITEEHKYKVDVLDSLWITLHPLQGQFLAPALMIGLAETGATVREITAQTARQTIELLDASDRYAWVERDGEGRRIRFNEVQQGDRVFIYPGDLIPVDGRVLKGAAVIDEYNLTSDATPVICSEGQEVYASTIVSKGEICVVAERTGKDTRAALIAQLLKGISGTDTQIGNSVEEVSDSLVLPTLFVSGSIFALTGNILPALALLQLDFGTGIGIAVPTTVLTALTYAARSGVYIRSGRALEDLARIDKIIFGHADALRQTISNSTIEALSERDIVAYPLADDQQAVRDIQMLQQNGKTVAYVGHRMSDSEAFAVADVSIALAEENDIERETADIVILGNDIGKLIDAVDIAKGAMEIVYQNIAIVAAPNISVAIAGVFLGLHPVAAVSINFCAALIAELNGLRPLLGTGGSQIMLGVKGYREAPQLTV